MSPVCLICLDPTRIEEGGLLAQDLGLEFRVESSVTADTSKREERRFYQALLNDGAGVLLLKPEGLGLLAAPEDEALWIKADFCDAGTRYRLAQGGGNEMIAKAVGLKGQSKPTVLDCTAGLGMDAYVLAALGCEVTLLERNPIVHA
ncbi:MAG: class I SAM-dependent methyltransferase, partial [Opitutales bacterium]